MLVFTLKCSSFFSQPGPVPLTIENVLFNALVKVGAVSQDNADNPTKVRSLIKLSGSALI